MFIENIVGIYQVDALKKQIFWQAELREPGQVGVKNFTFGDITSDLILTKGQLQVQSDGAYTLTVNGQNFAVQVGQNNFKLA